MKLNIFQRSLINKKDPLSCLTATVFHDSNHEQLIEQLTVQQLTLFSKQDVSNTAVFSTENFKIPQLFRQHNFYSWNFSFNHEFCLDARNRWPIRTANINNKIWSFFLSHIDFVFCDAKMGNAVVNITIHPVSIAMDHLSVL